MSRSVPYMPRPSQKPFHRPRTPAAKSSWEGVSDWYASYLAKPGTIQSTVVFPGVLRALSPLKTGRYLDIACGEGKFAHMVARTAREVVGFDAAPSLIARAEQQARPNTQFFVADAASFSRVVGNTPFDGATCILAIQNMPEITPVFLETSKVLKPGAPFILVLNHPSFRQPRQSGWGFDETRKLQYRRVDRYLTEYEMPILAHPGSNPHEKTASYHRPLSTYVNALGAAGFAIDAMEEWVSDKTSDSGPRAKAENVARAEIPLFLALRARKQ